METPVLLKISGLSKSFGPVRALRDVGFELRAGEIHAIAGENGAGKSTLMKVIDGILSPDSGDIQVDGRSVSISSPLAAQKLGIGFVHQEIALCPDISVAENIFMSITNASKAVLMNYRDLEKRATAILARLGHIDPTAMVRNLSISQQQMVEIAKALSYDSKLLVLDEPTATLTPPEIERLFAIIKRLKARGVTIIYISHRLHEVFEIGDRVTVLRNGRLVATRDLQGLTVPDLVRMMIGRDIADEYSFDAAIVPGKVALSISNLKRDATTPAISFDVRHGEILGVAGLVGSGRTEAMRALFGADPKLDGVVAIDGRPVAITAPKDAVRHGLSLLTEDRKGQGLLLDLPVDKNITITDLGKVSRHGLVNRRAEAAAATDLVGQLRVKASSIEQAVRNLSGGNQQKVVLAKWLFRGTSTLILDEPTRGVDIGARREIYQLLWMLAAAQKGIIMVSSDLPELMGMCHRIIVFSKNRIVGEVPRAEFDQERILSLAYQEYVRP
ncbi:MAG: sugar ABC transporter ATP-binding protein [Mesorhizobium sp.]|nr:MAG: sugar ABC transporter ATP-binding protein [Mesorhizobium sp.]